MARVNNKCIGKKLIVPTLVIILLCIGLGIILYQNSIQENGSDILLEIMATNDKNEQANSYEIWISSIYVNDALYDVGSIALPEGWELKDGSIFSANQNITNSLQIQIPNVHNAKINFQKHAWAGMVEIKCGDVIETVDLYADSTTENYEMTIFDNKIEENGDIRLSIILFVIGFVICYIMLYTFLKEKKGCNKAIAIVTFIAYAVNMYILYCTTPQIASTPVLRACLVIVSVVALFMNYAAWNNGSMDKYHTKLKILILCMISAGISLLVFGQNFISKYDFKITFSIEGALYSISGLIWIVLIVYAIRYAIHIKIKIAPVYISIFQLFISLYLDKFFFEYTNINIEKVFLYKLLFFLILILMWKVVLDIYYQNKQGNQKIKRFIKYYTIYFCINLVILIMIWPGNWIWDEYFILESAITLNIDIWQHYFTSLFYIVSLMIFPFPGGILIVQNIVISLCVSAIIVLIEEDKKETWKSYLIMLVFLLPSVLRQNFYPIRLSIYAYIELLVCMYLIVKKKNVVSSHKNAIIMGVLISILSVWRSEGIIIVGIYSIYCVYVMFKNKNKRCIVCVMLMVSLFGTILFKVPQNIIENESGKKYSYQLTALCESFDDLVKEEFEIYGYSDILNRINNYIDVNLLVEMDTGEAAFWNGLIKDELDKKELNEIKKEYIKLVLKYPTVFVKERVEFFLYTAGGLGVPDKATVNLYEDDRNAVENFRKNYVLNRPIDVQLRRNVVSIINGISLVSGEKNAIYLIFYNVIPSIVAIVIFAIVAIKKKNIEKVFVSVIYFSQIVIIGLCAPGKYFMYYFAIYIFGNLLIVQYIITALVFIANKIKK